MSGISNNQVTDDEEEDEIPVEIPPPMQEIQTHSLSQQPASKDNIYCSHLSSSPLKVMPSPDILINSREEISQDHRDDLDLPDSKSTVDQFKSEVGQDVNGDEKTDHLAEENLVGMSEAEKNRARYYHERQYVINELIDTERIYIADLAQIVEGYMKLIQDKEVVLPPTLEDKDKIVFGNVHQIYDWHKEYVEIQMLSQANAANHVSFLYKCTIGCSQSHHSSTNAP
jgi:hypothetical protein